MGLLFSPKKNNDINLHLLSKYTLLFVDSTINNEYNKTNDSFILPLSLYSIISVYSFSCFIAIIANKNNSTEIILVTSAFLLTLFSFVIYILFQFKNKLFNIKNTKYYEYFILAIAYIMMSLLDRIMCYHFKAKKDNVKDKFFFEFLFTNIGIIIKFLWLLFDINEFIFIAISNVISFIIICSYNDNELPLYYTLIITNLFIIFFHSVLSYIITLLQKKEFLMKKYQTGIEKFADLLNIGYFSLSMNSSKVTFPHITHKSSFFEQRNIKSLFPDDKKLLSILSDLDDINKDMKIIEDSRIESEMSNHYSSNGHNNYNNTNSQLFNIRDQGNNSIYKQNASGSEYPFVFQNRKKNSILNLKSINFKNESEVFGKRKTMLNIRNNNISIKRSDNQSENKDDIKLNINTDNSIDINNDDTFKVISMLNKYIKKNTKKVENYEYFGRRKIQFMLDKENINTSTVKEIYLKILFKYNTESNSYQFLFIDESQYQFDLIFKQFAQQISMYLHDFKNPLISLNEKIIELKEMFTNIHFHSHSDKAIFEFGKDFINEFSFLSITSSDCVEMIKSYESFSKKIVDPHSKLKLDLSLFNLQEILSYIKDWIDIKISQKSKEIVFSINYEKTIPKNFIMCTDKLKLKQVLINILSNSFKFTNRGFISLIISRESIDNKDYVKFTIQDSGIGMNEKTKQKLFEPYYSHNEDKNNKDGCGLGLVISQMMTANLGKSIEVESIEGQGTKMWFYCEEKTPSKEMESSTLFKKRKEMFNDNVIGIINNNSESYEVSNKYSMNELARPLSSQSIRKKGDYILDMIKAKTTKSLQIIQQKEEINTLKESDNTLVCDEVIAISPTNKIKKRKDSTNSIKRKSMSMFTKPKLFSGFKSSMNLQTISGVTLYNQNIEKIKHFNNLYFQQEIAFSLYGEIPQSQNCSPIILTTSPTIYSSKSYNRYYSKPNRDEKSTGTGTTNANTISIRGDNIVTLNSRRYQKGFSVLIIDDEKLCQNSLSRIINELNIKNIYIDYLYDGVEFLIRFLSNDISSYNLIIMDNHMRRIDGVEAINMISLMKEFNIGTKCRFDYNNILSKLWIYSADSDDVLNGLVNKESVGILSKPATKNDISNVLQKAGAFNDK